MRVLEPVAHHEATHAVIAHVLGYPFDTVTIVSDAHHIAHCEGERPPPEPAAIIVMAAGDEIVSGWEHLRPRANELVRQYHDAIERVTDALLLWRTLSRGDIAALMGGV